MMTSSRHDEREDDDQARTIDLMTRNLVVLLKDVNKLQSSVWKP